MFFWIIGGILLLAVLWAIGIFNGLVSLKNRVDEAKSDIDVQTKRRYDLIPNLVETVKSFAKHEKSVFEEVTKARTEAMKSKSFHDKAQKENQLTDALKSVFAVAESYPTLKSNENFLQLQQELTDTEDKIEAARRFYNANVRDFNTKIEVFPDNIVANMMKFEKRELFEATESEKEPVKVKF